MTHELDTTRLPAGASIQPGSDSRFIIATEPPMFFASLLEAKDASMALLGKCDIRLLDAVTNDTDAAADSDVDTRPAEPPKDKPFDIRTDDLLGAPKTVARAILSWRKDPSRPIDHPEKVVKWLERWIGVEATIEVIRSQLHDERYYRLMAPTGGRGINGKDYPKLMAHADTHLPPVWSCDDELYLFERGKYALIKPSMFGVKLHDAFADRVVVTGEDKPTVGLLRSHVNELTDMYLRDRYNERSSGELVLFRNGFLDLTTGMLHPPHPNLYITGGPDCDHDPAASCPTWLRFLDDQWRDDPNSILLLQEMLGLLLIDDISYQSLFLLIGKPGSGKGTIVNVIKALVGAEFCTSFTLSSLSNSFGLEPFMGRTVAISPDNRGPFDKKERAKARETMLQISGGDPVSVNRKNRPIVDTQLRTRLVCVFNEAEDAKSIFLDAQGAMDRRLRALEFKHSFAAKADPQLLDKLIAELPGIANWAIDGLLRLRQQKTFTANEATTSHREASRETGSVRFLDDCFTKVVKSQKGVVDQSNFPTPVLGSGVYRKYLEWCAKNHTPPKPQNWAISEIKAALPELDYKQIRCAHCQRRGRYFVKANDPKPICSSTCLSKMSGDDDKGYNELNDDLPYDSRIDDHDHYPHQHTRRSQSRPN